VIEQGRTVTEVAARYGVSRQSVHTWLARYRAGGIEALADRSHRPTSCPHQTPTDVEARVCELRDRHPRWGPQRIRDELLRDHSVAPVPSRSAIYRILVRHDRLVPGARRRSRDSYRRWERDQPMQLWQLDIMGGVWLDGDVEVKLVTGVDDASRYCVIATVVTHATYRAVCAAFAGALRRYGIPDEVLTDNGKEFTGRFSKPRPGEALFERICRDNGITTRLTAPASPTTTGKIERFHRTLRRDFLNDQPPFADLAAAQAAIDRHIHDYNNTRPHQSLGGAIPAERSPAPTLTRRRRVRSRPPRCCSPSTPT
jgi:transposase InsO family protein